MKYFFLIIIFLTSCKQKFTNNHTTSKTIEQAYKELTETIKDTAKHNYINNITQLIKDSATAIAIAEPILIYTYGKEDIIKQKPYEIFFVKNYWIISGTLPKGHIGGTFLIIINAFTAEVLKITHGK